MERNKLSILTGLVVFIIAELVYLLTLAPTASYWDCSEFITCAYKLEVGHAPGAPVFMLLGRLFSLLAGYDTSKVAVMINILSATASAFTILFLFKILVWFCEKLISRMSIEVSKKSKQILIYGASIIGALSYAFTDSFWFSAVEGEVYATSSLFSALVFWCIIKWEEANSNDWKQTRWIYLMFFLLGLSVGIHLLNMLALPAIALIYYSKRFKLCVRGVLISQAIALSLLVLFVFIIIPGIAKLAAYADLFFVNGIKLPVYTGAITFIIFLGITIKITLLYFKRKGYEAAIIGLFAFTFWLVGYSSFAVLVIRSNANPFVDINNVENLFGLVDYLNREQYPMRPLVKGNNYNSPIVDSKKRYTYKYYNGQYHKDELNSKYIFDKNTLTLFPRMASLDKTHKPYYEKWVDIQGRNVKVRNENGEMKTINVPNLSDNLKFFMRYQMGHMYFRYFMWNFVGRQNDIQGVGGVLNGNWISGISFVDSMRLGNQELLPDKYRKNKARNTYYFLPLILGLIGMVYHYKKDKIGFSVVMLLFLLTGVAIAVYLNEIPITPRERDYAYVGSFFAFSIWIGIGCIAVATSIKRFRSNTIWYIGVFSVLALVVPLNLLNQNWDDHNRSGRKVARDLAGNALKTLAPNSILFTYGDNDTYPIWYLQEVEGLRTDVRHVLHTFLAIDWYAEQLQFPQENKGIVPISFKGKDLLMSQNSYFPIVKRLDSYIELSDIIDFVKNQDERTKIQLANGDLVNFIPGNRITLKVNKENVARTCSYIDTNSSELLSEIKFSLNKRYLTRDQLLVLDIIAQNKWERPIYFMSPHSIADLGLGKYLHREGSVFRLLPFKGTLPNESVRAKAMEQYQNITQKYEWGNMNDSEVYLGNTCINTVQSFRYSQVFSELAIDLFNQGEFKKAEEILALYTEVLPTERLGYNAYSHKPIEAYYLIGNKTEADAMAVEILEFQSKLMHYFESENKGNVNAYRDLDLSMYLSTEVMKLAMKYSPEIVERYGDEIQGYYSNMYVFRN